MISAKIIEDSMNVAGVRLTTFQLLYPRLIHSEVMTHRAFSRNASSSRAIPVKKMLEMVRTDPAMPIHWGKNQAGMQAKEELSTVDIVIAKNLWLNAANSASHYAEEMMNLGLHKQVANRILEPYQHISVVMTTTDLTNWNELRYHEDADPNIYELARVMKVAADESTPVILTYGDWHLPYVTTEERLLNDIELVKKLSTARCCRVSYLKHDGDMSNIDEDLALYDRLVGSRPLHSSPAEHQATPDHLGNHQKLHGNFTGWVQHRKLIERDLYGR